MYSSENIDIRNWVHHFESRCILRLVYIYTQRPRICFDQPCGHIQGLNIQRRDIPRSLKWKHTRPHGWPKRVVWSLCIWFNFIVFPWVLLVLLLHISYEINARIMCHIKYNSMSLSLYVQGVYKWMAQFQKLKRNLFLTLHGQNVHR